jgi:hypothetical protein
MGTGRELRTNDHVLIHRRTKRFVPDVVAAFVRKRKKLNGLAAVSSAMMNEVASKMATR